MGGLVHSMDQLLHIGLLGFRTDDASVSFTVWTAFEFLMKPEAQQTDDCPGFPTGAMCRGSNVKDKLVTAFQLESLILAQNERWRQA